VRQAVPYTTGIWKHRAQLEWHYKWINFWVQLEKQIYTFTLPDILWLLWNMMIY